MNLFALLYQRIYDFFDPYWAFTQDSALRQFRTYLGNPTQNGTVRMWVDASAGNGHQASTIAILRQLIAETDAHGFGFTGRIEVYCNPGGSLTGIDLTLPKLYQLLPELRGEPQGHVGGVPVQLVSWNSTLSPTLVNLGFSGGSDDDAYLPPNIADRIGVRYLLRLQPYLWEAPNQIQFHSSTGRSAITLTEQSSLGYDAFNQRAYFVHTPIPQPQRATYAGTTNEAAFDIVQLITAPDHADDWAAAPVYSIRTAEMQLLRTAAERFLEVLGAALASQRLPDTQEPAVGAKSVVIVSCDAFGDENDQEELAALMAGGPSGTERRWLAAIDAHENGEDVRTLSSEMLAYYQNSLRSHEYRAQWLTQVSATDRVRYLWEPTPASVGEQLEWLAARTDRVLLVSLGRVPEPLFQWLMQQQGWPSIFEGQNTATLALNIGKPYFHVARPGSGSLQYPSTIIGHQTREPVETGFSALPVVHVPLPSVPRRVQDAADQLTVDLAKWTADPETNPAEQAGGLVRDYYLEGPNGPLHSYFDDVRGFYSEALNDKLRMGAAFLQYVLRGAGLADERLASGADEPLDDLLRRLADNTSDGQMHVAPGAFEFGGIFRFYTGLFPAGGLVLQNPKTTSITDPDGAVTSIETTGAVTFDGIDFAATIVYTAPEGIVVADAHYQAAATAGWAISQIPWIGLDAPFIELHTPDADAQAAASFGGTAAGPDLDLAFRLPVAEGMWQLTGGRPGAEPSIDRFFQLAGGIDLVRALPAPFDGLAGFGLRDLQLAYDVATGQVRTAGFRFATNQSFPLLDGVEVTSVNADVTVHQASDLAARRTDWIVRGAFTLGDDKQSGTVEIQAVGPDPELTGALVSGDLDIEAIINAFAPHVQLDAPGLPVVTEFQCAFDPDTGDYSVAVA